MSYKVANKNVTSLKIMENLLITVYGNFLNETILDDNDNTSFPLPIPINEAGKGESNQRRYLWTDAFGVLGFVTLAKRYQENIDALMPDKSNHSKQSSDNIDHGHQSNKNEDVGDSIVENRKKRLCALQAAKKLIDAVHRTLGNSDTSGNAKMRRKQVSTLSAPTSASTSGSASISASTVPSSIPSASVSTSASKNIGLRIGKTFSSPMSDAGFHYDGQYFHYFDKWIFALARYSKESDDIETVYKAIELVKECHPYFVEYYPAFDQTNRKQQQQQQQQQQQLLKKPRGIRWKINVDASPIPLLGHAFPSSDAIGGYIAYSLLQQRIQEIKFSSSSSFSSSTTLSYPEEFYNNLHPEIDDMYYLAKDYIMKKEHFIPTTDSLGWGCMLWNLQWIQETDTTYRMKQALISPLYRNAALNVYEGLELPFRLYGALIGCNVSKVQFLHDIAREILNEIIPVEESATIGARESKIGEEQGQAGGSKGTHAAINKVMLANAIDPYSLSRYAGEERFTLHGETDQQWYRPC